MASKAVVDAVEARIAGLWAGPSKPPVVGMNLTGKAPNATDFIVIQYPVGAAEQITVGAPGANVWRETGVIRIVINAQRGKGMADALQWADELAGVLRGKAFAGVQTFAPSPPTIDDDNDQGNFFRVTFGCEYQHDVVG